MKAIGAKLREKRRELKLSYSDVAKATRMPKENIRAMEDGDFAFFKDDISYVRFYLRAYCKYLDVSFDDYKDIYEEELNEYSETLSLAALKEHEEIEEKIASRVRRKSQAQEVEAPVYAKKDNSSIKTNVKQGGKRFRKPKFDFSLISLLAVVVIVVVLIVTVTFTDLFSSPSEKPKDDKQSEVKTPDKEEPKNDDKKEEESPVVSQSKLAFVENSAYDYTINGVKAGESVKIEVTFNVESWFMATLNNENILSMQSATYPIGTTLTYDDVLAQGESMFYMRFGNYRPGQITILVNGEALPFNAEVGQSSNTVNITLRVVGAQ